LIKHDGYRLKVAGMARSFTRGGHDWGDRDGGQSASCESQSFILFWGAAGDTWMRDPSTVAAIVDVLRQVHGDDLARFMLNDGFSLAILIDALLRSPLKNRD
jgi:hypothetical protein